MRRAVRILMLAVVAAVLSLTGCGPNKKAPVYTETNLPPPINDDGRLPFSCQYTAEEIPYAVAASSPEYNEQVAQTAEILGSTFVKQELEKIGLRLVDPKFAKRPAKLKFLVTLDLPDSAAATAPICGKHMITMGDTIKIRPQINTFQMVACLLLHEIGHYCGARHSVNAYDIMYPMASEMSGFSQYEVERFAQFRVGVLGPCNCGDHRGDPIKEQQ